MEVWQIHLRLSALMICCHEKWNVIIWDILHWELALDNSKSYLDVLSDPTFAIILYKEDCFA